MSLTTTRISELEMLVPGLSYEAYLEWLDPDVHAEWMDGKVVLHSPVSALHMRVGQFLIPVLRAYLDDNSLGQIFYDPFQIKIGPDFPGRAPDITFLRNENAHRLQDSVIRGAPDLIVEIVSPGSRNQRNDREIKFGEYERGGVPEYWLIDPEQESVEVYVLSLDGRYVLFPVDSAGRYHSTVLPNFFLTAEWLWNQPKVREVVRAWERG